MKCTLNVENIMVEGSTLLVRGKKIFDQGVRMFWFGYKKIGPEDNRPEPTYNCPELVIFTADNRPELVIWDENQTNEMDENAKS